MKKIFMALMMVAALLIGSTLPVAAESTGTTASDAVSLMRPALAIKAPASAVSGERVPIYVLDRQTGKPVAKAEVWAVGFRKPEITTAASISAVGETGIFLGWTNEEGCVVTSFKGSGWFLLTAFREGYAPGFSWILVKPARELAIKAPGSAQVGEPVTITVYETTTNIPVAGARVWAILSNVLPSTTASNQDMASYASKYGIDFGETNNLGQVTGKFEKQGQYILVAVGEGYQPGFSKISVGEIKALVIRAPEVVMAGKPFPLRVVELSVLTVEIPVPKATVWAVSMTNVTVLDESTDLTAVTQKLGIHLGYTDEQGYIKPDPVLNRPGAYWLIALKDEYKPGLAKISVKGIVTATPVPLPSKIQTRTTAEAMITKPTPLAVNTTLQAAPILKYLKAEPVSFTIVEASDTK